MDIKDNCGGGTSGGTSGVIVGGSGALEYGSVWCGFIFEGYGSVGSVFMSVVIDIVGFLF